MRREKLRKYLHVAVALAVGLAFALTSAHVSAASHASASTTPPKLKAGVNLTVWDYFCKTGQTTCPERDTEWTVIKQWEKISKDKVNFPTNPDSHDNKMCTAGPAKQGPDLVAGPHNEMGPMVACQTLAPVPAWAWSPADKKKYIKAAIQSTTLNGKSYSMPWAIETTGLFYNKALIKPSAFTPAKGQKYLTWAKLIKTFQKLNVSNGLPFGWDQANFYFDYAFISGNGGYVFKYTKSGYDYRQIGLDTPGAIKGIQFIGDLNANGKYKLYPASMNDSTASGLFTGGKLAAYYTGPWNEANFDAAHLNYGFAPLPSFDGKLPSRPFSGLQVYAINAFSAHKNEAASLMAYLTTHMQTPEFHTSGRIPVITSILNSKTVQKNAVAGGLAKAALAAVPMPNIAEMNQVWTPMGTAIGNVVTGKDTAASAAKAAVTQIKADIAKAHG
jgi:arabinogalactan oligomer / maltooligosaccharide transport system substrate-binding protein